MNPASLIAALRGAPQQQQGPDLLTAYRQYVLATQEQGQQPMPQAQWAQMQQQAASARQAPAQ